MKIMAYLEPQEVHVSRSRGSRNSIFLSFEDRGQTVSANLSLRQASALARNLLEAVKEIEQ